MEKWVECRKGADFAGIAKKYHIDPVIARLIRNRDVVGDESIEEYLCGGIESLHSPFLLKDMERAVDLIGSAIDKGKKIRIIGDYDIDGVMSSYILLTALLRLGAHADGRIPNRITDGYGLNVSLVEAAHADGAGLILTCDNGIAAASEIASARELGMEVIVTDHHEIPFTEDAAGGRSYILPEASAVINPKRPDCSYPYKGLCGAAVAWKLVQALYQRRGLPAEEAFGFLEFAGFATVGDVMDLTGENRILVKEGLKRLRRTKHVGMKALIEACNLRQEEITSYQIGFVLGPCLNASGRLDTAERAVRLLREEDADVAAKEARGLKELNDSRKQMTLAGVEAAEACIANEHYETDKVLVLYLPGTHESLAGIIAGRIREHYNRPVFVLTDGAEGAKGSGRSIEAYDMYAGLTGCASLLTRFGGHKMAAGLTLKKENVGAFRRMLNENCNLSLSDLVEKVVIDAVLPFSYIRPELTRQLTLLEPFGKANTKPVFAQRNLRVTDLKVFGKNRNVAKMRLTDASGCTLAGICFGDADSFSDYVSSKETIGITYYPSIDTYRGKEELQLVIRNYC